MQLIRPITEINKHKDEVTEASKKIKKGQK